MIVKDPTSSYQIYTDGGCLPNRTGAWAFIILKSDQVLIEQSGTARRTTSTRMELQAVIMALQALPDDRSATLWTDSRVVLEIVETKLMQWKNNNWLRSRGQQVIDLDLILELDALLPNRQIKWQWVRAHSGNRHNDYCDTLCRLAVNTVHKK